MTDSIKAYYDALGQTYDENRFGSSYGKYIHEQEVMFLDKYLPAQPDVATLDMGCGTGRFLTRATDGLDFSQGMLAVAQKKFPEKRLSLGDITHTDFSENIFSKIFSMHVVMHLSEETTQAFILESYRLLEPGGLLVFDFPSQKRRGIRPHRGGDWHGANSYNLQHIQQLMAGTFKLVEARGILFFPIHRFPGFLRHFFLKLDNFLCRSFLKEYASYLILVLQKK